MSYPKLNQAHGFMTWLHVPVTPTGTQCCAPRTVKNSCGSSAEAISGPILGKNAPHAPVAVSMGDEGSMIFMLPETNTVVVTHHLREGNVRIRVAAVLGATAMAASYVTAKNVSLSVPETAIRGFIASALVASGASMLR